MVPVKRIPATLTYRFHRTQVSWWRTRSENAKAAAARIAAGGLDTAEKKWAWERQVTRQSVAHQHEMQAMSRAAHVWFERLPERAAAAADKVRAGYDDIERETEAAEFELGQDAVSVRARSLGQEQEHV